MCEKKNENEDEAENEGPRTNRRGEVLMSRVKMWRRGGEQSKQVKGAEVVWHCLIPLLQKNPPPLQFPHLFRNGPASAIRVSTIRVTTEATMVQLLTQCSDNNNKKHLSLCRGEARTCPVTCPGCMCLLGYVLNHVLVCPETCPAPCPTLVS